MPAEQALLDALAPFAFHAVLILARAGAAMMLLPGLGETEIPASIRLAIALALVPLLLPPLSHAEFFFAYLLAAMARGLIVGVGVFAATMLTPISMQSMVGQLFNGLDVEALHGSAAEVGNDDATLAVHVDAVRFAARLPDPPERPVGKDLGARARLVGRPDAPVARVAGEDHGGHDVGARPARAKPQRRKEEQEPRAAASSLAAARRMVVCPSCPQACITPGFVLA